MAKKNKSYISSVVQNLEDLQEAKRACSERYLKTQSPRKRGLRAPLVSPAPNQNVVGVGISEKIVEGLPTGIFSVKIYVRVKYPLGRLLRKERLPKSVYGMPVDVVEVGTLRSLSTSVSAAHKGAGTVLAAPLNVTMPNPREKFRPARPGCSIGFEDPTMTRSSVGTFGALVRDANGLYILSNNHVIADENELPLNSNILQPAFSDGFDIAGSRIAKLANFVRLVPGVPNKVDCAIAKVAAGQATNDILHIGPPKSKGNATEEMNVHKFGRSTAYRVGRVIDVQADVTVAFERGSYKFEDQIMILGVNNKAFAQKGDSGALVLERDTQKVVGLLFGAGVNTTTGQIYAVANHINDVLNALGVSLVL